jgi:hypothetical protein
VPELEALRRELGVRDRGITGASIRYNFIASSCDLPAVSSCPCHPYAPLGKLVAISLVHS